MEAGSETGQGRGALGLHASLSIAKAHKPSAEVTEAVQAMGKHAPSGNDKEFDLA